MIKMAHLYVPTMAGPSEDLLDAGFQDLCLPTSLNDNSKRSVTVDACDLFQCGKCLKLFTSLTEFVSHKEIHCQEVDIYRFTYPSEGTSSDDSNSQYCDTSGLSVASSHSTSSLLLASNELCDNQINKEFVDGLIGSSLKVTAFDSVQVVSNGGLPVDDAVPGSIFSTDITNNSGELFLVNDNNNNESESICELVSLLETNISSSKNWKCNICSKVFTKLFNLKQHIRSHTGERPFHCILCGKKFTQISNAKKHISLHKVWPEPWESTAESVNPKENPSNFTASLFSCRYCPLAFNSFAELKVHKKKHSSHKVFKCLLSECKETFGDVDSLTAHLYNHSCGTFHCSVCNLKFPSFAKLSQHHIIHSFHDDSPLEKCVDCKEESFPCPLCDKVLANEDTLRRHLPTHLQRSFPCPSPACNKYFASLRSAKSHFLTTHSPTSHVLRYKCDICQASFKRCDNLVRHSKSHQVGLQFKCPFSKAGCSRAFSRRDILKNHLFTHVRKRNKCKVCKEQMVLCGSSINCAEVICNCPQIANVSVYSDDDEGPEMRFDEGTLPSDESITMDIYNNGAAATPSIDFEDVINIKGDIPSNALGSTGDFEKSFLIPQEGTVSCDDENTIEIIVGIA